MNKKCIRLASISFFISIIIATLGSGYGIYAKGSGVSTASAVVSKPAKTNSCTATYSEEKCLYRSHRFNMLVNESFHYNNTQDNGRFYQWLDKAYSKSKHHYHGKQNMSLENLLKYKRNELDHIKDINNKAKSEIEFCAWTHAMIKEIVPKFSLDRGFEFYYTLQRGERQCYLQSVLISGLLQSAGINSGVVMVYRNIAGEESNNGHALVLVKLPNGHDITVDASEPMPFPEHKGLFVRCSDYKYVSPVYNKRTHEILHYRTAASNARLSTSNVHTLDFGFIRSQFWYYRGERASGGLVIAPKTQEGLKTAARALRVSIAFCPKNPLPVYMLGRVYYSQGKTQEARNVFENASKLYSKFGWSPSGLKQFISLASEAKTGGRL